MSASPSRGLSPGLALLLLLVVSAPARAQHPGGTWRTLETAHFRVHVRPAYRDLGVRAAGVAETAWGELAGLLPAPGRRVDLVVADNVDDANGFASTYPIPTIVVYAFPPTGDVQLAAYDSWLRLVLTHELVHVFHLERTAGWWRVARAVFGRVPALFPNQYTPTWLIEGTAVYYETRVTGTGRLDGPFFGAVVDAQLAERGPLPLDAAGALSPRWPGGVRAYAFGSAFLADVARRHGDSALPRLIAQIARRPLPYVQLNGALTRAAGVSFGDAWGEWMKQRQYDGLTDRRTDGPNDSETTVLCCLRSAASLKASADGRRLLFVHADGVDVARLGVWDRDAGALRRTARVNSQDGVAWQGASAIVAELEFADPYTLRGDLFAVDRFGDERRLTHGARLREPAADARGGIVAVRVVPGGNELVRLAGDSVTVLQPVRPDIEWSAPAVAPDGATIAAVRAVNGRHDIVLLDPGGAIIRQVTDDAATDRSPAFTPDGAMVVWSRETQGGAQIAAMRLADGATFRLTHAPFGAYAPAPAGDSLFYFSYHADGYRLVAVAWEPEELEGDGPTDRRTDAPEGGSPGHGRTGAPDSAVVAREHGYSPFPALWPHYWLPSLVPAGAQGSLVGAFTSSQDPLGRHFYVADGGVGVGDAHGRFRGLVYYAYAGLPPLVLDAQAEREQEQYWLDSAGLLVLHCCLANDDLDGGVTWLRRRFRSALSLRLGGEYERVEAVGSRAGASLSLGYAHTAAAPLAISIQRGWRARVTARRRWRLDDTRVSNDVVFSAAAYQPATVLKFARQVLALRGAVGFINGTDPVNFGVGGLSSGSYELLPGLSVGGSGRSFPVRGYQAAELRGRSAASFSVEFRSPLALVGRGGALFPPVTLDRLSTAIFADVGAAWSTRYCADSLATVACGNSISSAGAELVVDAGLPYDFPVRFRIGGAWRFGLRSAAMYLAVGSAF